MYDFAFKHPLGWGPQATSLPPSKITMFGNGPSFEGAFPNWRQTGIMPHFGDLKSPGIGGSGMDGGSLLKSLFDKVKDAVPVAHQTLKQLGLKPSDVADHAHKLGIPHADFVSKTLKQTGNGFLDDFVKGFTDTISLPVKVASSLGLKPSHIAGLAGLAGVPEGMAAAPILGSLGLGMSGGQLPIGPGGMSNAGDPSAGTNKQPITLGSPGFNDRTINLDTLKPDLMGGPWTRYVYV